MALNDVRKLTGRVIYLEGNVPAQAAYIESVEAETLPPGSEAYARNDGSTQNVKLVFGIPEGVPGRDEWGAITGTLSDQTDLQDALDLKANAADVYTKSEADDLLDLKADKADSYIKEELDGIFDAVDNALSTKADKSSTYTKTETNTLLNAKANAADVYSKTQADTLLNAKADKSSTYTKTQTDNLLAAKANSADVYSKAQTYSKTETDNLLSAKANSADVYGKSEVYTKGEVNDALAAKADAADVYTKTATDALLLDKAPIILNSASGSIASFSDGSPAPVTALTVRIEPVQSGTGDPSPDNVRPISGHTEANIFHEAEYDPTADPVITIDLDGTRYGGTLNVLTGEMTVDKAYVADLGSANWQLTSGTVPYFSANLIASTVKKPSTNGIQIPLVCSALESCTAYQVYSGSVTAGIGIETTGNMRANDGVSTTAAEFKTAMSGVQLVYELANPVTVQLSPSQLSTLLGQNNIWSDTGNTDVTYRADTKRFIEGQVQAEALAIRSILTTTTNEMVAPKNLTSGDVIIVGNDFYKMTANVSSGSALTVGTNCVKSTMAEWILSIV